MVFFPLKLTKPRVIMSTSLWRPVNSLFTRSAAAQPRHPVGFSLRKRGATGNDNANASSGRSQGNRFFLSGATIATLLMLGGLHARRLYDDRQAEQAKLLGMEQEFEPDFKAAFLQILPLRFISRTFGVLTSTEIPVWAREYIYKGYSRAFHANLDEVGDALENYPSLKHFFSRSLKQGCRPVDTSATHLVSPVDGVVLRCGLVKGPGLQIEQVKGHSYSVKSLLGGEPPLMRSNVEIKDEDELNGKIPGSSLFYCVLYLGPGDYHRIHSPTDWKVLYRRHFSGRLFPVNERAMRTITNLYVGNERVVLEGVWSQGFMSLVAVGATNVGSIELKLEPELKTNSVKGILQNNSLSSLQRYGHAGSGIAVQKGDEVARFTLGSTVVLVFEAPNSDFTFCINKGERIKMGQVIGKW